MLRVSLEVSRVCLRCMRAAPRPAQPHHCKCEAYVRACSLPPSTTNAVDMIPSIVHMRLITSHHLGKPL